MMFVMIYGVLACKQSAANKTRFRSSEAGRDLKPYITHTTKQSIKTP